MAARRLDENLGQYLFGAALYTWREAAIGFVLGALLGLALATIFVHVRLLERALVPYVIASQTIPIIALAPLIVFAVGQGVFAVVIIATYLTFFPVTIAMIRGLRSVDPRAIELMRSYAASPRRDLLEGPPPGIAAVPVHRAEDLGDGEHRRGDHRRGHGRHPAGPRPGHHDVQPVLRDGPGEALGGDHRRLAARGRILPGHPRGRDHRPPRPARRRGRLNPSSEEQRTR